VLPPESFIIDPWYLNFFNNMALVQFDHRLGAWLLAFLVPWFWWKIRRGGVRRARLAATLLLVVLFAQIGLGIATLLLAVPVGLGAAHQGGAMVVLGLLLWLNHELRPATVASGRATVMASQGLRLRKVRALALFADRACRCWSCCSAPTCGSTAPASVVPTGPPATAGCWRRTAGAALRRRTPAASRRRFAVAAAGLLSGLAVLAATVDRVGRPFRRRCCCC
jgi:hypothetical protein